MTTWYSSILKSNPNNPSRVGGRYYIMMQLRGTFQKVADKYLKKEQLCELVDYGCGNKPYFSIFNPMVKSYKGADFTDNSRADIFLDSKGNCPINTKTVDVVLSSQVLEHVINVDHYLNECNRLLKENGIMILSTHGYWIYHPHPTDLWRWTKSGLEKIISEKGFVVIDSIGVMGPVATSLQILFESVFKKNTLIKKAFSLLFLVIQKGIDKKNKNYDDACVYVVIAKKEKDIY